MYIIIATWQVKKEEAGRADTLRWIKEATKRSVGYPILC